MTGSVNPEDRQKEVERFQNDSDCKICIGTIGAMGTGITLTAASTVIFADKDWTVSANRRQRIVRIVSEPQKMSTSSL